MHCVDIMAYTNKKPWWLGLDGVHGFDGLGEARYLGDEAVDARTMVRMAFPRRDGLPGTWQVEKRQAGFKLESSEAFKLRETFKLHTPEGHWIPALDEYFLVRNDDLSPLGRCKGTYAPFQIEDVFSFMDSLREDHGLRFHTAGSLMNGKKVWALAQLPGEFVVKRLDGSQNHHVPFLLMSAGHDGATAIWLMPTDVRAECWNTVSMAESSAEHEQKIFGIVHTASAKHKVEEAKVALDLLTEQERIFAEVAQELARARMRHDEFRIFANAVLLDVEGSITEAKEAVIEARSKMTLRSRVILDNKVDAMFGPFRDRRNGNLGEDRYDALQAVTQSYDHRAIDARYAGAKEHAEKIMRYSRAIESTWFGTGAKRKGRALRMLAKW